MHEQTYFGPRRIALESRRYIGCKTKLLDWIFMLTDEHTRNVHSFCDIFAGTGVVSHRALEKYERVVVNDFLFSNQIMYRAFFADLPWDEKKVESLINDFNRLNPATLSENYFSKNFGGKYFHSDTAKIVGYIRGQLKRMRPELTEKEYAVLLASLIYSIDRQANTLGHFDAYQKRVIPPLPFDMRMVDANRYPGAEIYREDANKLARKINVDVIYLDPPYLITFSEYNKLWNEATERSLLTLLDDLNERGVHFAISNVTHYRGRTNTIFLEWSARYNIHSIKSNYISFNDNSIKQFSEVLATNY